MTDSDSRGAQDQFLLKPKVHVREQHRAYGLLDRSERSHEVRFEATPIIRIRPLADSGAGSSVSYRASIYITLSLRRPLSKPADSGRIPDLTSKKPGPAK